MINADVKIGKRIGQHGIFGQVVMTYFCVVQFYFVYGQTFEPVSEKGPKFSFQVVFVGFRLYPAVGAVCFQRRFNQGELVNRQFVVR